MQRVTYVLIVVELMMLGQSSYAICKRCNNYTKGLARESQSSQIPYALAFRSPMTRDTSYLPEEDYAEENESRQDVEELARDSRNLMPEYRNLCEVVTRKVQLTDPEYDYQPPHYHEIFCKSYSLAEGTRAPSPGKQKCAHPGFHCVQRSRTLFLVRRRWDSECWEPFTKEIASGCDCMWPVSVLGDITAHY